MNHLVTGGSGFLGNLITRRLLAKEETVSVLDVWKDAQHPEAASYIECDIRNEQAVASAMRGIDVVHHNVALVPLTKSGNDFETVNVEGSRIAARQARKAGVSTFVHMSSSALFGAPKCPITNDSPLHPIEIYGRAKLAGEQAVREELEGSDTKLIVIRPRTILGEGRLGIFQILFEWISENRNVYVIGSGDILFQFIHAHDLMSFYMLAIETDHPGTYNVGAAEFGTLRGALEELIDHVGSTSKVKSLPTGLAINSLRALDFLGVSPLAPWHYLTYHKEFYFDVSPLLELGWQPQYSNQRMLRESYDWYIENGQKPVENAEASAHRSPVKQGVLSLIKKLS